MTTTSTNRPQILTWLGRLGAASAEDVAVRFGVSPRAARSHLAAAERDGLVEAVRLLQGHPALYVATRAGLRAAGLSELKPCRVSPGGFLHHREVARAAVALERTHPDLALVAERELRVWERDARRPIASAELGIGPDGEYLRHRPDLVLWPPGRAGDDGVPATAIEVELTVKAAPRLAAIVRGWARSRLVDAVVYYAAPAATRALRRAVADEQAHQMVHLLPLDQAGRLPGRPDDVNSQGRAAPGSTSPVPSAA